MACRIAGLVVCFHCNISFEYEGNSVFCSSGKAVIVFLESALQVICRTDVSPAVLMAAKYVYVPHSMAVFRLNQI